MSSPLATFRKNREFWMAALVLLAILAFVVAPAIETASQAFRGGGSDNTVFVRWDGGRLTRSEVEIAMQKRNQLLIFLRALAKKVIENGGEPAVPGFSRLPSGEISNLGVDETVNAERVCLSRILSTQANRMGIEFDDEAADEFLKSFCNQKITDEEFYEILRSSTSGLSLYDIRELIKQELAFLVADNLAGGSMATQPPGKTWGDFLKLNQTAKVEAYPVYVNEFVSKVQGLPSEAEVQEIFEQGKNLLPNQYSELPGLMRPAMANAEYIESRFQDWIEREKAKLTEEEIRAEYDRMVTLGLLQVAVTEDPPADSDSGDQAESETSPDSSSNGSVPENPEAEVNASAEPASEAATPDNSGAAPDDSADTLSQEPAATETPSSEPANPEPADSTPADSTPAESEQSDLETPNVELSSSDRSGSDILMHDSVGGELTRNPFQKRLVTRLVTHLQEEESAQIQEEESAQTDDEIANADEASSEPAGEELAQEDTAQPSGDAESPVDANAEPEQPEMRTKSFEEARDEVATDLAKIRARPIATEVLTRLQQMMREYHLAFRQYQAYISAGKEDAEAPVRPDLKKFAEQNGLVHGETGLSDSTRLSATSLGMSGVFMDGRRIGFASEVLTAPQIELFFPLMSGLAAGDASDFREYYFWKVDSRPAAVPQLNEVRDEVINAWRQQQARSLAEEAARNLGSKVGTGDDPWSEALNETLRPLVVTTDSFPWLSRMGMGMGVSTTYIPQLDGVGEDFMRQVFSTELGGVGVAPNQAKSVYYVFRVVDKLPTVSDLEARFEADQFKQGPLAVAQMEQSMAGNIWLDRVFNDLNVKFEN